MSRKKILKFVIFFLIALATVNFLPRIDKVISPNSSNPGFVTFLGIGIIFIFLTIMLFFDFYKEKKLPKTFLVSAIIYSILIITVRFILSPLSLYDTDVLSISGFSSEDIFSFLGISTAVFLLYFLGFFIIYKIFDNKLGKDISKSKAKEISSKMLKIIGFSILVGAIILIAMTPVLLIMLLGYFSTLVYLDYVFSSWFGLLMALCLIGIVIFVTRAFNDVTQQAMKVRDAGVLATFFWFGAILILAYSALWFVYLLVLISIWPIRTFIPSIK